MKYIICCLFLIMSVQLTLLGQCNHTLVDRAAQMAGPEAVYIRDFKVKLTKGNMENPSPVGRFPVYLNEGVTYRFTLASDSTNSGTGILQLVRKDKILGSTYDFEKGTNIGKFDFACSSSSTYQVLVSFQEGQAGCTAGVLSVILEDSLNYIRPNEPLVSDSAATLYLFVENRMNIAATGIPGGYLEVRIDNGSIEKRGGEYVAIPKEPGRAVVHVDAYKRNGELSERDSLSYFVRIPPLPNLEFPGLQGNVISKEKVLGVNRIQLQSYLSSSKQVYELVEFTLSREKQSVFGYSNNDLFLTQQQINLIRSTPVGERIYLTQVRFRDPEGNIHTASTKELWIED